MSEEWEDPGFDDPEDDPPDADDVLAAAVLLKARVEAGEIGQEQAEQAAARLGLPAGGD